MPRKTAGDHAEGVALIEHFPFVGMHKTSWDFVVFVLCCGLCYDQFFFFFLYTTNNTQQILLL